MGESTSRQRTLVMPTEKRVREVRERMISTGTVEGPDGSLKGLFPVAIGAIEGESLRDWVVRERASRTLETGLGFALSTLFICEGLLTIGTYVGHVAVDPFQMNAGGVAGTSYSGIGLRTLEAAGVLDLVEFYEEESQVVLPRLLDAGRRFDLAFIDGNHRFEAVFLDLIYAGRLVREGGIVFVDDSQMPAVDRAIEFCVTNLTWAVEESASEGPEHAWRVLRTGPAERWRRPFKEFVDFG